MPSPPPTRTTATDPGPRPEPLERLRRPAAVDDEIAAALGLDRGRLLARAAVDDPAAPGRLSAECLVHLLRRALRRGDRELAEALAPRVLTRAASALRGAVRGFDAATAAEVREEVLGRLAVLLADPGDGADFFEARFALALKRLRLDVCRRVRRRPEGHRPVERDAAGDEAEPSPPEPAVPAEQEARARLAQALASLPRRERQVLVLHRLMGVPLASARPGTTSVSRRLGVSERTARNLLRRAEARLEERPP